MLSVVGIEGRIQLRKYQRRIEREFCVQNVGPEGNSHSGIEK